MYSFRTDKMRFYPVELPNGKKLNLEPPKLKALQKIAALGETTGATDLADVVATLLTKNKEGYAVSKDRVAEWLTADQCADFISEFMDWVNHEHETDPN